MRLVSAILVLLLSASSVFGEQTSTIIGPSNIELQDGANALRAGDVEEGIRLTRLGMAKAINARERQTGNSNLCAGYALLGQYTVGLPFCDAALQENDQHWRARSNRALIYVKLRRFEEAAADLVVAESISPNSSTVKAVRKMYLDATDPVAPSVVIDDRRTPDDEGTDDDG